jgi:hypothetical protein
MTQRSPQTAKTPILPRLSAPLTKLRKQWLNTVKDLDPQAALAVLRQHLKAETDEATRLGNIAAQSWIVRLRLNDLQSALHGAPVSAVGETPEQPAEPQAATEGVTAEPAPKEAVAAENEDTAAVPQSEGWTKLRIIDETEVNGMRFFAGTTIQVHEEDARKLIEAKSAELVEPATEAAPKPKTRSSKKATPKK